MSRLTGSHIVRVAIVSGSKITEIALPTSLPIREILPAIEHLEYDTEDPSHFVHPKLSLSHTGGVPFSLDATLETLGVIDGDLLTLQTIPPGQVTTSVVEDIADATAILATKNSISWEKGAIQGYILGIFTTFFLALTGSFVFHTITLQSHSTINTYRQSDEIALLILSLIGIGITLFFRKRNALISILYSFITMIPLATSMFFIIPEENGISDQYLYNKLPCAILAIASISAWSLIAILLTEKLITTHTCISITALIFAIYLTIKNFVHYDAIMTGCSLIVLAVCLVIKATPLATFFARLSITALPAPGDLIPPAPSKKFLADLPRRIHIANSHQNGFIAAATIIGATGCAFLIARLHKFSMGDKFICWLLIIAFLLGSILRSRIWISTTTKLWLLSAPIILYTELIILFFYTKNYSMAFWVLAAFALTTIALSTVVFIPNLMYSENYSLVIRRTLILVCSLLDIIIIPSAAYLTGIFTMVLKHNDIL